MENKSFKNSRYFSVKEVAEYMHIGLSTVYARCSKGYIPSFKLGSRVLIDKEELLAMIEQLKKETRSRRT